VAERNFEVGVVIEKRRLKSVWASHAWLPHAVLPAVPDTAPGTPLEGGQDAGTFYAGVAIVRLTPSETAHYRDNLRSGNPSLWVGLRATGEDAHEVSIVTADPYEGEALAGALGEIIEAVPMPPEIQDKVAAFVEAFHVERPFFKRKRDRADPNALARRKRGGEG
jgi:hypothetical protein